MNGRVFNMVRHSFHHVFHHANEWTSEPECVSKKKFKRVVRGLDYEALCNAFHAAGESTRQVKILTKFVKNVKIVEFHDHKIIWSHHEKCIQKSTNMPGVGSLIREIDNNVSEI